jgi:hypothetical protein
MAGTTELQAAARMLLRTAPPGGVFTTGAGVRATKRRADGGKTTDNDSDDRSQTITITKAKNGGRQ